VVRSWPWHVHVQTAPRVLPAAAKWPRMRCPAVRRRVGGGDGRAWLTMLKEQCLYLYDWAACERVTWIGSEG
jgi:hypothetical protein